MKVPFTTSQALQAIKARLDGVWDNEQLVKLGPLSNNRLEDIRRIINITEVIS
jgi:hypothetical protein